MQTPEKKRFWLRLGIGLSMGAALIALIHSASLDDVGRAFSYAKDHQLQVVPAFLLFNTVSVAFLLPSVICQLFAGAVFGLPLGFLTTFTGTLAGQCLAFLTGRHLFREGLAAWISTRFPSWSAIEAVLFQKDGMRLVVLLRLSPVLPDSVMSYALSLTCMPFKVFIMATALAMLPWSLLYCYVGSASGDIMQTIRDGGKVGDATTQLAITVVATIVAIVAVAYVGMALKKALKEGEELAARQKSHAAAGQTDRMSDTTGVQRSSHEDAHIDERTGLLSSSGI